MAERTNNQAARSQILTAIRQNLAASQPFDSVHHEHHAHQQKTKVLIEETTFIENAPIVVAPEKSPFANSPAERFKEALEIIGGNCTIVNNECEAAAIINAIIAAKSVNRAAVSDSFLVEKVAALFETNAELLRNWSAAELFDCDLGITGAQWAIAETGTLVLESDRENHRLASLVPAIHICLINAVCIRQTLGEILSLTGENGQEGLSRTITFITGPSRTSDIELTLAIGVHGPAELHVIVVEN